jgi:DNA helicase HerA-like ATPase
MAAKRKISIGPGVDVDLDRLIGTRLLVQANSGGGKSWAIRRLLEQTHGKVQQIVIDPEGEFATLREKFDYVLAARQGGDTLADPRTAKLLAERLLELGVSAILDIYELQPRERVSFVKLFLEALVDAKKELWHPVLVVLDEAHVFAPEQGHGEAESDEAVKGLATRGRKRGFCLVAATQRLSKLHKDVAAECNNKLIGRTGARRRHEARRRRARLREGRSPAAARSRGRGVLRVRARAVEGGHPGESRPGADDASEGGQQARRGRAAAHRSRSKPSCRSSPICRRRPRRARRPSAI